MRLDQADITIHTQRGSGKGGQHRNKTDSEVRAVHIPTGITATVDGRSQWQNRQKAMAELEARVAEAAANQTAEKARSTKRSGFDRNETVEWRWVGWRDQVIDPAGRKGSMRKALRGRFGLLGS